MAVEYAFDFYAPDVDPDLAVRLVRMTIGDQLHDAEFVPQLTGYGRGWIEIHADDPDAVYVQKRTLVQAVRIDTDPEQPVFCFWLEEGEFDTLSRDEQVGRILRFEGPGGLYILDRYVLGHSHYAAGQDHRGTEDVPDKWTWNDVPYGAILVRLIEEGQGHPQAPYAPLQIDFTRTRDSNDLLWDELADYQVDIGTSGSKILADFLRLGLVVQCAPDLTISAYREVSDFGTDRSSATFAAGKVRFQAGQNIANPQPKRIAASQERSFVLIRGRTGDYLTVDEDINGNPLPSVPYGTFLKSDTTADPAAIQKMGELHLTRRQKTADQCKVRHKIGPGGINGADGYNPGPAGDYWLGDIVTVHTGSAEHDYSEQPIEVAAIRFFRQGNDWMAEAELGAQYLTASDQRFATVTSVIRNTGTPIRLCEADVLIPAGWDVVAQKVLQWPGGGADLTGSIADISDLGQDGDIWFAHASRDAGDSASHIPDPDVAWNAIGSGGSAGGAGSGVAQRGAWKAWDVGDTDVGSWVDTHYLMVFLLRGADDVDPIGDFDGDSDPTGDIDLRALTLEVTDGTSRVLAFAVHESEDIADNGMTGTPAMTALEEAMGGQHGAWISAGVTSWGAHAIGATNDDRVWANYEIKAAAGGSSVLHDGMEALVGTSTALKRCDSTNVYEAAGSAAPTVNDDREHGFIRHTFWLNEDGELWVAVDVTNGAAVWIQLTAAAAGAAPDDATYLVTTAHAGLSAEVAVGATPGGELGGTWAAPTVDAAHSGSTHAATQAAAEATAAAALTGHTGDATDAHDASAVSYDPTASGMVATDVQDAIDELDAAIGGGGHAEDHDHDGAPTQKLVQANTHESPDTDTAAGSLHHTIGAGANQAAAGNHSHAGGAPSFTRVTADITDTTGTGTTSVTGLSFAVAASTNYRGRFVIFYTTAAATTGIGFGLDGPGSPTAIRWGMVLPMANSSQQGDVRGSQHTAFSSASVFIATAGPGAGGAVAYIEFVLRNGANAGTIQVYINTEVNGSEVRVLTDSYGEMSTF